MKRMTIIILILISFASADSLDLDVNQMIVKYSGETIVGSVDSIGREFAYFVPKDSVDSDSLFLRDIYYIYNDFNRVFQTSWSFDQNIQHITNRTGTLYTLTGDTIDFINIEFNMDMTNPEVFIKTNITQSEFIPLLNIEKIITDLSVLHYSIERGFIYSLSSFLIATTLEMKLEWDSKRRMAPQIMDNFDDLMPKATLIGLSETGVTYESVIFLIPISVFSSVIYDTWRKKQEFYFNPIHEQNEFGRNMYLFSIKQIAKTYVQRAYFRIEKTKFGRKVLKRFK